MNSSRALSKVQLNALLKHVQVLYPPAYADSAWDNTGLLIDCSVEESSSKPKVLLTVDLTSAVAREAIDKGCNLVLAYHPFIFPSWKRLSPWDNTQHKSAIKLIQNGISVYSPHTAVDAAKNGINDWLVQTLVSSSKLVKSSVAIENVTPIADDKESEVGYGRYVRFHQPMPLKDIISNIKQALGIPYVQVAGSSLDSQTIRSVALCAGSGSSVLRNLKEDVDLYYTGELSHHEVLRYREQGKTVILCNHSNTERGYLRDIMYKSLADLGIECIVSETDADPLVTV